MNKQELNPIILQAFDLGAADAKAAKERDHSEQEIEQASYDLGYDVAKAYLQQGSLTTPDAVLPIVRGLVVAEAARGWDDAEKGGTEAQVPQPYQNQNFIELFSSQFSRVYHAAYELQKSTAKTNKYLLWGGIAGGALLLLGIGFLAGKPSLNPVRALLNPARKFTVKLDNMSSSEEDPQVTASVSGPGAAKWAKDDQDIDGSRWESTDPDFAYAVLSDYHGLVDKLQSEGYDLDLDEYFPPDGQQNPARGPRQRYTEFGSYPLYYYNKKGEPFCYKCALPKYEAEVNWENPDLYCTQCEERIESAYAEDEAKKNPARGGKLKTEQDTPAMEKRVRRAANIKFGREKKNEQRNTVFEHGQWWLTISPDPDDPSDLNTEAQYSVIDASPGLGSTGLDFERL